MGLLSQKQITWKSAAISFADIVFLLEAAKKESSEGKGSVKDRLLDKLCEYGTKQNTKPINSTKNASRIANKESILCLAESLLYEQTHHSSKFMHGAPTTLCRYNEEFAADNTKIVDGPPMVTCKGCFSYKAHHFLTAEGTASCRGCKAILCRFCRWDDVAPAADENGPTAQVTSYCMECKSNQFSGISCDKTEVEMRDYLNQQSVHVPASATYVDVWQMYTLYQEEATSAYKDQLENVKFPLLSPKVLHPSRLEADDSEIKVMHPAVPMIAFAGVLNESSVPSKTKADLLHFMAALTRTRKQRIKGKKETLSYEHVLGDNLISMVHQSRVHPGDRTMERAVRHTSTECKISAGQWS